MATTAAAISAQSTYAGEYAAPGKRRAVIWVICTLQILLMLIVPVFFGIYVQSMTNQLAVTVFFSFVAAIVIYLLFFALILRLVPHSIEKLRWSFGLIALFIVGIICEPLLLLFIGQLFPFVVDWRVAIPLYLVFVIAAIIIFRKVARAIARARLEQHLQQKR